QLDLERTNLVLMQQSSFEIMANDYENCWEALSRSSRSQNVVVLLGINHSKRSQCQNDRARENQCATCDVRYSYGHHWRHRLWVKRRSSARDVRRDPQTQLNEKQRRSYHCRTRDILLSAIPH